MKKMVNIAPLDEVEQGNTHYPWPKKAIFSIYGWDGELAHRTERGEAVEFDLSDVLDACMGDCCGRHVFGIRVGGKSAKAALWTEKPLQKAENTIRYDICFEGFEVHIERLKGVGSPKSEEMLWIIHVSV
jgi:hypothetical protein|tara:strand:- start:816 stop:1205 length:390 start_codon:yes stop_codon:yes gene_type:complete